MKSLNQLFQCSDFEEDWMSFCGTVTGGVNMKRNLYFLHKYPKVIIGTCGVLKELASEGLITPTDVKLLILDEIDMAVKLGFVEDVLDILKIFGGSQIMGFSATADNETVKEIEKGGTGNF